MGNFDGLFFIKILRKVKSYIFLLLAFTLCKSSFSQKTETGAWYVYFGNQSITKKWTLWNEMQYRNYNAIGDLQQLVLRIGLGYNLTENNNNVLCGYAFVNSHKYVTDSTPKLISNEHRIYQQFISKQTFGRLSLLERYRIEERFFSSKFELRFRISLLLNIPLNHKTMSPKTWYAALSNEVFVNAEEPLFDRNRIYGGIGFVFDKNLKLEAGMMSQILDNSHRNQIQITLFNTIPFYK